MACRSAMVPRVVTSSTPSRNRLGWASFSRNEYMERVHCIQYTLSMYSLREKLAQPSRFLLGVELVTTRGTMADRQAIQTRAFAADLVQCNAIDWVSIT